MYCLLQPGKAIPQGATILKLVSTQAGATPGKPATLINAGQLGTPVAGTQVGCQSAIANGSFAYALCCHLLLVVLLE